MKSLKRWVKVAISGVLLTVAAHSANAQIYKCTNAGGSVSFSESPCPKGNAGGVIQVQPNTIDTAGDRERNLRLENQALKEKLANRPTDASSERQMPVPVINLGDSAACKSAKRDYEVGASSTSTSVATLRFRESAMYGACGMREPDRNTTNININSDGSQRRPSYVAPNAR